ncbi:MAG: hypothetical protein JSV67_08035 [Thermoplasmatales archaeon]|jgi:hypothetical protein|nr:MAG: hypothetical protein JSV67_08035 [Thermoplasmatales archaeon]
MVNRESLPLIVALLLPIILVVIILLYFFGYDITLFLREVNIIYYIIIFPIALGFTVAIIKYMRPD